MAFSSLFWAAATSALLASSADEKVFCEARRQKEGDGGHSRNMGPIKFVVVQFRPAHFDFLHF
jgi:hypothetical protein